MKTEYIVFRIMYAVDYLKMLYRRTIHTSAIKAWHCMFVVYMCWSFVYLLESQNCVPERGFYILYLHPGYTLMWYLFHICNPRFKIILNYRPFDGIIMSSCEVKFHVTCHAGAKGERKYTSSSFLTALDLMSGQRHALLRFTPWERTPGTHCIGGWVGLKAGLDTRG
jgi:hypothetical protein